MLKNKFNNLNNNFTDDVNPMDGIANLSDAMLVLAVGIMLALVINWKIDIGIQSNNIMTEISEDEMKEVESDMMEKVQNEGVSEEQNYKKTGTVYTDEKTGKTYIIMD